MQAKFCSCSHSDRALCQSKYIQPCPCACHDAERRPVGEVEGELRTALEAAGATMRVDRAESPQGPSFFMVSGPHATEVTIEYEPGEGFDLDLKGYGRLASEGRVYALDTVIKHLKYWFDGNI